VEHRLASEPDLLTNAAEALRAGTAVLPDALADEFDELGGPDQLEDWPTRTGKASMTTNDA
jgi:hypothetical protein